MVSPHAAIDFREEKKHDLTLNLMLKMNTLLAALFLGAFAASCAAEDNDTLPLDLKQLDSVIYIDGLQRAGELPSGLSMLVNLADAYKTYGLEGTITAVFDDEATPIVLSRGGAGQEEGEGSAAYHNIISDLIKGGVVVAVCGNDLSSKGISRGDLLPGVKVTPRGILLVAQLERGGAFCLPTSLPGVQGKD